MVVGNRRPYLGILLVPNLDSLRDYARREDIAAADTATLLAHPLVHTLFERQLDEFNSDLPSFSQIKKFALLSEELTLEAGELTPTLKVKRFAIDRKYRTVIDELYPTQLTDES